MSHDDLFPILELGWQSSREAWQLLAPNDDGEFTIAGAAQTGRLMDQLAYDLRRIGFVKPARLAYSVAFVLNSLANETIAFEPEIAEKTSQVVSVLAEMLLELEAMKDITISEPVEIVEQLKSTCGFELDADESTPTMPSPHFHQFYAVQSAGDDQKLISFSQELVEASGSLLNRVIREGQFPHTAALGRIHHLATLVRDQVISEPHNCQESESAGFSEELRLEPRTTTIALPPAIIERSDQLQTDEKLDDFKPGVLILDQSPFIRMLLTTAIESAGYVALASADCEETLANEKLRPWNIMVCGISDLSESERGLLASRAASWKASIITFDGDSDEHLIDGQHRLQRSDLNGLLSLIKTQLGPINRPVLMSA